jgi:hypothetical protein
MFFSSLLTLSVIYNSCDDNRILTVNLMLLFLGKEIQTKDQGSHVLLLSGFVLCRFGYIMQQDVSGSC